MIVQQEKMICLENNDNEADEDFASFVTLRKDFSLSLATELYQWPYFAMPSLHREYYDTL